MTDQNDTPAGDTENVAEFPNRNPLALSDLEDRGDGEPRIQDLRLAEALGFADRHMIRRLIERHGDALKQLGEVSVTVTETSQKGGRPGKTYWLTSPDYSSQ